MCRCITQNLHMGGKPMLSVPQRQCRSETSVKLEAQHRMRDKQFLQARISAGNALR